MLSNYCSRCVLLAFIVLAGVTAAHAQEYPVRPIVMVMPYAAGGPGDIITRLYAAALQIAVADPEVKARLDGLGVSTVSADRARPEALRAHLKHEIETLGPLLINAGVKAD